MRTDFIRGTCWRQAKRAFLIFSKAERPQLDESTGNGKRHAPFRVELFQKGRRLAGSWIVLDSMARALVTERVSVEGSPANTLGRNDSRLRLRCELDGLAPKEELGGGCCGKVAPPPFQRNWMATNDILRNWSVSLRLKPLSAIIIVVLVALPQVRSVRVEHLGAD